MPRETQTDLALEPNDLTTVNQQLWQEGLVLELTVVSQDGF